MWTISSEGSLEVNKMKQEQRKPFGLRQLLGSKSLLIEGKEETYPEEN